MGEEEDDRPSKLSTMISPTHGYHGHVNPYYLTFFMTSNTYSNPYPYHWSSQHPSIPPVGPTMPYPLLSNPEELRRFQETGQHPAMPYPPLSNPDELKRFQETS